MRTDLKGCAARIRQGDREAFSELVRRYLEPLCNFADGFVATPETAEEIVQDVFMALWINREEWHPRNVKAYLYASVRNKALDHLKHQEVVERWRREAAFEAAPDARSPYDDFCHLEFSGAVQSAIDQLPPRCRMVFLLSRQHELTYKEIAETLEISVNTVESQMRRAFRILREELLPFLLLLTSLSVPPTLLLA